MSVCPRLTWETLVIPKVMVSEGAGKRGGFGLTNTISSLIKERELPALSK